MVEPPRLKTRIPRWADPKWTDVLSVRTQLLYAEWFRPFVGFNPAVERVTNG